MIPLPPQALTMEEREQQLREVFETYASFGVSRSSTVAGSTEFMKFFKDGNMLDTHLNATALDIHFTKAKTQYKDPRKLNFDAFLYGLQLAAITKYGSAVPEDQALELLINEALQPRTNSSSTVHSSESSLTQPTIPKGSVFDRLTNTKAYTGTHKERFDKDGRGRGKAGRSQDDLGTKSLEHLVTRK